MQRNRHFSTCLEALKRAMRILLAKNIRKDQRRQWLSLWIKRARIKRYSASAEPWLMQSASISSIWRTRQPKTYWGIANVYFWESGLTPRIAFAIIILENNFVDDRSMWLSHVRNYFGAHGIGYSFIRTPMGSSDFSTRPYTYAMTENDTLLHHFTLQMEDHVYKVHPFPRLFLASTRIHARRNTK